MRTKMCKYGDTCKYNHPEMADAIPAGQAANMPTPGKPGAGADPKIGPPDCAMNSAGYPLRPGTAP